MKSYLFLTLAFLLQATLIFAIGMVKPTHTNLLSTVVQMNVALKRTQSVITDFQVMISSLLYIQTTSNLSHTNTVITTMLV